MVDQFRVVLWPAPTDEEFAPNVNVGKGGGGASCRLSDEEVLPLPPPQAVRPTTTAIASANLTDVKRCWLKVSLLAGLSVEESVKESIKKFFTRRTYCDLSVTLI